eukprot:6874096-Pyramimonas_sp.AAC.1
MGRAGRAGHFDPWAISPLPAQAFPAQFFFGSSHRPPSPTCDVSSSGLMCGRPPEIREGKHACPACGE